MLDSSQLVMVVVAIPILASLIVFLSGTAPAERYHLHHDTYSISRVVPRTLVLVMIFMGVLGALTVWLCNLDVYYQEPEVPLLFFVAFQVTAFLAFVGIGRLQVMTYDDRMLVRPWFGRQREVRYADIDSMRRSVSVLNSNFDDLRVRMHNGRVVRISGLLDIEQILVRIDRFEVLEA